MNTKEMMKIVNGMDNDTLNILQEMINTRKANIAYEVKYTLRIGDKVKVNHPRLAGQKLTVTAIRQKRCSVRNVNGHSFNVPLTMIIK